MPRPALGALVCGAAAVVGLAACQPPALVPPPDPVAIALQPGDLPSDYQRCQPSGAIDGYLRFLATHDAAAHDELAAAWQDARGHGAQAGAVTVYADQPAACAARLATGPGPNATSVVVRFQDESTAHRAYQRGMLGFATPNEDQQVDGLTTGAATGLGQSSWMLERTEAGRTLLVAYWEHGQVMVMYLAVDVDPLHAKQAMATLDGRIG